MILFPAAEGLGAGDCLELHSPEGMGWQAWGCFTGGGGLIQEEQPADRSLPPSFVLSAAEEQISRRNSVSPDAWWVPVGRRLKERVWCFSIMRGWRRGKEKGRGKEEELG